LSATVLKSLFKVTFLFHSFFFEFFIHSLAGLLIRIENLTEILGILSFSQLVLKDLKFLDLCPLNIFFDCFLSLFPFFSDLLFQLGKLLLGLSLNLFFLFL
jgi:hypothetical protein